MIRKWLNRLADGILWVLLTVVLAALSMMSVGLMAALSMMSVGLMVFGLFTFLPVDYAIAVLALFSLFVGAVFIKVVLRIK